MTNRLSENNPLIQRLLKATKIKMMRWPQPDSPPVLVAVYDGGAPYHEGTCSIVSTLRGD